MKPRLLVISFSDLASDPRVSRQIDLLSVTYEVSAVGYSAPKTGCAEFIEADRQHWSRAQKVIAAGQLKLGKYETVYWSSKSVRSALASLEGKSYDVILANDILALPLAARIKGKAPLLFDAHEYAPLEFEESWRWRFFLKDFNHYLCRTYLPQADAMTTVCDGIAAEYLRNFGIPAETINNAPRYFELAPSQSEDEDTLRMVHHGAAIPSRQIELMIEAAHRLDNRFTLDLMLVPSVPRYFEQLKACARKDPRIRFLPTVPMADLPVALNRYDLGIYLLPPNNFNNRFSLPNKFFEFIQARLAIAIGPSPEMAHYVKRYDMGAISCDFSIASFANTIDSLDRADIARFKAGAARAAQDLCFEKNAQKLLSLVSRMETR